MVETVADLTCAEALERRFGHLRSFDHVIVAVSGGGDSTALMRLVHRWAAQQQLDLAHVDVVTVDHDLRPGSSDEAREVCRQASALGLQHSTVKWEGDKPEQGLQSAARAARYQLLCELANKRPGRSVIVTAHNRDDQAETVLMRLARGSGPDGLSAIPAISEIGDVAIYRPLLDVPHDALIAFLESEQADWIEDPTNDQRIFERVRIRQAREARDLLGLSDVALARTAKRMARARKVLELSVDKVVADLLPGMPALASGVLSWSSACRELPDDTAIRLLRRMVYAVGGQKQPPALGQVEEIYEQLMEPDFSGGTLHGCRLMRWPTGDADALLFREIGRSALPEAYGSSGVGLRWDDRFQVWCESAPSMVEFRVAACSAAALAECGDAGLVALPTGLPRDALRTLPAVWVGDELVSVPGLSWNKAGFLFCAEFLQKRLRQAMSRPFSAIEPH